jgi:hypothetical protein
MKCDNMMPGAVLTYLFAHGMLAIAACGEDDQSASLETARE